MQSKNKIENYVFDNNTHKIIYNLAKNNIIESIDYPIASGKEAITFLGHLGKEKLALKIYKIETSRFKHMYEYIEGDYRFRKFSKDRRDISLIWASKEYKNLMLASAIEVSCPLPIAKEGNILVMSFIGDDEGSFPKLKDFNFDFDVVYPQIIDNYAKMLYSINLVHADFSQYNILINPETQKITVIDFGQAVITSHPKAKEFLKRDIINMTDFLNRKSSNGITYKKFLSDLKEKKDIYGRNYKSWF